MVLIILIAFFSLIALIILHEFSHFALAKKFGVEVEEFGIGYPPRLVGKKIGETIYSLNLLPFGAFVKIPEGELKTKPFWQRFLILIAGIVSFWVICTILITIIFYIGAPFQVSDEENENLIDPRVQIVTISPYSPAEEAGLGTGDIIASLKLKITPKESLRLPTGQENEKPAPYRNEVSGTGLKINKVKEVQEFTNLHKGQEIVLTIKRGEEIFEVILIPRISPPEGEGPLGVGLVRIATKKYSLLEAPVQGILTTLRLTWVIFLGIIQLIKRAVLRKPLEVELVGPVGILDIFVRAGILGPVYFLQTIAIISLHVAIINALPIPVVDGGRVVFLAIEKIRKKPLNEKIEQRINFIFFALLITLMLWVTMKDIGRIF